MPFTSRALFSLVLVLFRLRFPPSSLVHARGMWVTLRLAFRPFSFPAALLMAPGSPPSGMCVMHGEPVFPDSPGDLTCRLTRGAIPSEPRQTSTVLASGTGPYWGHNALTHTRTRRLSILLSQRFLRDASPSVPLRPETFSNLALLGSRPHLLGSQGWRRLR